MRRKIALRCSSWRGGSIAMNIASRYSVGWSASVIPPSAESEENIWWLVSTFMISLYFVIDQNGPDSSLSVK